MTMNTINNQRNEMNDEVNLLVVICTGQDLIRHAIKIKNLPYEVTEFPKEPKHQRIIWKLLPEHIRSSGEIVEILHIADINMAEYDHASEDGGWRGM